ncbi:hypothetical protein [Methylobacterium aquaticum]|jgi:hypothetical protein|uniref:hypothetical protein n=1 Tax=Methylobacterium aquaticum TaxID=270351 RepID=UPI0018CCD072|nr:hypothetical protein [Methylobacterium aquaticum]
MTFIILRVDAIREPLEAATAGPSPPSPAGKRDLRGIVHAAAGMICAIQHLAELNQMGTKMTENHYNTPTRLVEVDGIRYAYRRWGKKGTVPLFHIIHIAVAWITGIRC